GLVVLALAAHHFSADPLGRLRRIREQVGDGILGAWLVRQCRSPLNHVLAALLSLCVAITWTGGITFELFGKPVSARSCTNLLTAAYAVFFWRLARWYWRAGHEQVRRLGPVARSLVCWHAWPVALWFLW